MGWLQENGYRVDPGAEGVLDAYVDRGWAFFAVKLNPGEKRRYENEFLPPLTIRYRHDRLVYPLRISSISTADGAKITLYVIAESATRSINFPTINLKYEASLSEPMDPEEYIEDCIKKTTAPDGRGLAVLWSGTLNTDSKVGKTVLRQARRPR